MCSADISVAQLSKEIGKLQENDTQVDFSDTEENEIPHNLEFNRMSFHSAKRIREAVKDMGKQATSNQTLPVELELSYESAAKLVQNSLYNHLAWLLTDLSADVPASGKVELDQAAHEKVLNLAQDIMGNVNKIPTPKQVGLSLHILKETRSKKTVTLLNRLGNCISYDDAQRYMTAIAENVDLQIEKDGEFIPLNLTPGVFTHCAIDNLDFDEYTRDGSTLHATTIIFYQYPVGGNVKEQVKIPLLKRRSRSL